MAPKIIIQRLIQTVQFAMLSYKLLMFLITSTPYTEFMHLFVLSTITD